MQLPAGVREQCILREIRGRCRGCTQIRRCLLACTKSRRRLHALEHWPRASDISHVGVLALHPAFVISGASVKRLALVCAIACAAVLCATASGIGADTLSGDVIVSGQLEGGISITDPTALDSGSSGDTSLLNGTPDIINLGRLDTAPQMQQARATWKVSTTSPTGYSLSIRGTGSAAPAMQNTGATTDFPDMCTVGSGSCPALCTVSSCPAHQSGVNRGFGIAAGDPDGHAQAAVTSTWGTQGVSGTQGTLFGALPVGITGVIIAQRSSAVTNDPVSVTFAARQSLDRNGLQEAGSYQATIRLTAITI